MGKTIARMTVAYVTGEYLKIGRPSIAVRYIGDSRRLGLRLGLSMTSGEIYCVDTGAKIGERIIAIPKVPRERSDDHAWTAWAEACFGAVSSLGMGDRVADAVEEEPNRQGG